MSYKDFFEQILKLLGLTFESVSVGCRKHQSICERAYVIYAMMVYTEITQKEMAELINYKDHTTIWHYRENIIQEWLRGVNIPAYTVHRQKLQLIDRFAEKYFGLPTQDFKEEAGMMLSSFGVNEYYHEVIITRLHDLFKRSNGDEKGVENRNLYEEYYVNT